MTSSSSNDLSDIFKQLSARKVSQMTQSGDDDDDDGPMPVLTESFDENRSIVVRPSNEQQTTPTKTKQNKVLRNSKPSSLSSPSTQSSTTRSTNSQNSLSSTSGSGGFWKRRNKAPGGVQQIHGAQYPPRTSSPSNTDASPSKAPQLRQRSSSGNKGNNGLSSFLPSGITDLLYRTSDADARAARADAMRTSAPDRLSKRSVTPPLHKTPNNHNNNTNNNNNNNDNAIAPALAHSTDALTSPRMTSNESTTSTSLSSPRTLKTPEEVEAERLRSFNKLLASPNVDLEPIRKLGWKGVPPTVRAEVWQLLVGYVPTNAARREAALARKRREYHDEAAGCEVPADQRTPEDLKTWNQISIDMPRAHPRVPLFRVQLTQDVHRRILFTWAQRHPASGYVQGINDLATPFFVVFLAAELGITIREMCQRRHLDGVSEEMLWRVEADTYWCFSRLLTNIQDNYTFAQPGIQRMVFKLRDVVSRVDRALSQHLASQECQFIQFSFRWFNCLLMRELRLRHVIRMWDTYLCDSAECGGFASFHAYVCAAFLCSWSKQLRQLDFQEIMLFLQNLPTDDWTDQDIELLLSQAFVWYSMFEGAQAHLDGPRKLFS
mmetsp:Transcript_18769/g.32479  ORF Transcript_18769/g.32479 Transcript_18769/m.32479 type:complete len:605 (+) Transcript_18769:54-1868(+)